ncbi:MptD family putative ECF transporter S component [Photobacterium sp. WH77]|uniref:MptD family putative ECF transporter S component n=1 Tax=Photobacterium TaxID=657 RepID=UPI001EDA0DC1|nr:MULTISPECIES: MptD family putative ECF transporter S component [Photobacterium]MCG2839195.1 MptD family putative ECF transporter S component [Photobacterium sp. WH77]MCG2846812.1 MptD family putative ECF transporter S component [Photobacterium sp. WH80]
MTTTVSLTECAEEYKQQQHQQVLDAEVVHEWECVLRSKDKPFMPFIMIGIFSVLYGISYFLSPSITFFYMWAITVVIFAPVSYFLFDADYDYKGQITPKGIIVQQTERVPEIFYKATRGMAYIGIVVCVIAALMVGPLAFVGAGAFALMSFKMTGFHKKVEIEVIPFILSHQYEYEGREQDPIYQYSVFAYYYDVLDFERNNNLEYWVKIYCQVEQFPEVDKIIRQYIDVTKERECFGEAR